MFNDIRVGSTIAWSSLKRGNKKTTILTIAVLTLIFINLIFLPSMITGMMDIFTEQVLDYGFGNIVIEPSKDNTYINNADSLLKKINTVPGVSLAAKRLSAGATLIHKGDHVGTNILGVEPNEEVLVSKFHSAIVEGEFLTKMSKNEIVLGIFLSGEEEGGFEVYDDLGGVKPGTLINVSYGNGVKRQYKLKGIHQAGSEIADMVALINFKELEDVLGLKGKDKASMIIVRTDVLGEEAEIKATLIGIGVKENVQTWQEKIMDIIEEIMEIFGMVNQISRTVSVIISIFVLFIVIYIHTLNKRKEIGILKAIGISSNSIIFSYMALSMFYTISGIILGGIFLTCTTIYFTINPVHFYGTMSISPKVEFGLVFQSVIGLIIAALIAGFLPSWMVTKTKILDAIWGK